MRETQMSNKETDTTAHPKLHVGDPTTHSYHFKQLRTVNFGYKGSQMSTCEVLNHHMSGILNKLEPPKKNIRNAENVK